MRRYVLLYVKLASLLVTLVKLNVRKWVYTKRVSVHSSQNVNFTFYAKNPAFAGFFIFWLK
jgi:uncharacterized protein YlbG (UPF0298 family)